MSPVSMMKSWLIVMLVLLAVESSASEDGLPTLKTISQGDASRLTTGLDQLVDGLDRSQFDLDVLLDRLDYDETRITEFVTNEIAYDDYPGVLRGSKGTLTSRAGNSLDQSILLAHLLKEAGLDARIVQGAVPASLLQSMLHDRRPPGPSPFLNPEVLAQTSKQFERADTGARAPTDAEIEAARNPAIALPKALSRLTDDIYTAIEAPTAEPASAEQAPYYWVEYRLGPSDPWQASHPALGSREALADLAPQKYIADKVDPDLQQRVRVQAFIERSVNGKLETQPVTKRYEYPAANLSGVTFTYSVIPSAFLANAPAADSEWERMLAESALFFPVLDFGGGNLDKAFDTMGTVLDAQDAADAMAPLFQTVGKGFLSAADALGSSTGSDDDGSPGIHITRHWIEITLLRPGKEPKVFTRDIARWQGDESVMKQSLARVAYFRVETGNVSSAEFLDRTLSAQRALMPSLTSKTPLALDEETLARFSLDAEIFLLTSDIATNQNGVAFRAEPAIVARYLPYGRIDAAREGFDIINAPRVAVSAKGAQARAALYDGIVDTWLEHQLFADQDWSRSAFGRLQQRLDAGGDLTVLSDGADRIVPSIPEPARALIAKDLQNDQRVVLVGSPAQCDAWWRVDPLSGATVGVLANGWGGVIPEYLQDLAAVHGKLKVASLAASCGIVVPFITAGAAINSMGLFDLDEALGFANMDFCSLIPFPNLQGLCTLTMAALSVASTAGAAESGLSTSMLVRICVMSAL